MRLRLDGHRLTAREVADWLDETGLRAMSDNHTAAGYRLNPVRAPRRMENGTVIFALSWPAHQGRSRATLRLRVVMDADPI